MLGTTSQTRRQRALAQAVEALEKRLLFSVPPLLDPLTQPKFVNPLPLPGLIDAKGGGSYSIAITQQQQQLGIYDVNNPADPNDDTPLNTTVWGYNGSYPGPTIEAKKGTPIDVKWENHLVDSNGDVLPHLLPVDTSVHWAFNDHANGNGSYTIGEDGVPVVTHLHGGHVEAASDGGPDAWFTPGFAATGPAFEKQTYSYANDQDAATLWYHDHALGITRLNVYAGLAGYYYLRDGLDTGVPDDPATKKINENPLGLPTGEYEVPIAIQDRMFTADGKLFIPSEAEVEGAPSPSILPEFFGDHILVNGKAWPFLEVEPRKYRLRMLNGSDSRFYSMTLPGGPSFLQIGTDQGLLEKPVEVTRLTLGPGERADVIIDFAGFQGTELIIRNDARTPFPDGDENDDPLTTGQIMKFVVNQPLDATKPEAKLSPRLNPIRNLVPQRADNTRQLALFEMEDSYGRLLPQLGTVNDGALRWDDSTTEIIRLGDTEVWEIYNNTMDAHPIHLHLVKFQVLNRQKFTAEVDENGAMSDIELVGRAMKPAANERGWKDTVVMMPGEVTRIIATFDKPGTYVWHCHILSHEDHEMMRRLEVVEIPTASAMSLLEASPSFSDMAISGDAEEELLSL
jgi:spore coat protein A